MATEKELKLIPMQEISKEVLISKLIENGYKIQGQIKQVNQEDAYYDTPDKAFYNSDKSFRIRRVEGKVYITYKVPQTSEKSYTERNEFEVEIPEDYVKQNDDISFTDALYFLKQKYPNIAIPENLELAVQVNNIRSKVNVETQDGTVMELAFDDLTAKDENGDFFKMNNEIECEVLLGNPDELENINNIISSNFDVQKNTLSKYVRSIKEMREQKQNMTLEELTICAMLSDIISTNEFEQLKHKGQILPGL